MTHRTAATCSPIIDGDVAWLPLAPTGAALVDTADAALVAGTCWSSAADGYVLGTVAGRSTYLHRLVLGLQPGDPTVVDHANGLRWDARRVNLRPGTRSDNLGNQQLRSDSTTGYKGVSIDRRDGAHCASIRRHGIQVALGRYPTPEDAARVYDAAAQAAFGPFAATNADLGILPPPDTVTAAWAHQIAVDRLTRRGVPLATTGAAA